MRAVANDCIGTETLVDVVDGRADRATLDRVEAHASRCATCREVLSSLAKTGPSAEPAPEPVGAGSRIGRYAITRLLGAGGMGVVYAAHDPELDRAVALKLLRGSDPKLHERLRREAQALAQLAHPNVVAVHDVGTFEDRIFVAMELVPGETLAEWLKTPRTDRAILDLFVAAGRGLAAAHAAQLVHRDFKPENVLVGADGRVRVADFGLARAAGATPMPEHSTSAPVSGDAPTTPAGLTASGALMGTPYYMAPEQYRGEVADESSDQFSFCVALYTALYRQRPFAGDTVAALAEAVQAGRIEKPPRTGPRRARAAILRGLSPDPAARFPAMAALLAELAPRPRYWLWAVPTAGAAAAAIATVLAVRAEPVPPCQIPTDALPGIWDATRKGEIAAALARSLTSPAASVATVTRLGDDYAARWRTMRKAACEATQIRKEQPEAVMELRMACLDGRARALRAVIDQLATADRDVASRAVTAMAALPAIEGCGDLSALRSAIPLPTDPVKRQAVDAIRAEMDTIHALRDAGRYRAARERAAPLPARAQALDYAPVSAEVHELAAKLAEDAAAFGEADRLYGQATLRADAGRHDSVRARVLIAHFALLGGHLQDFTRATALGDQIAAVMHRLDRTDELEADLALARGAVAQNRSELANAEEDLKAGLAILTRLHGANDPRRAAPLRALGSVLLAGDSRTDEAARYFAEALALQRAVYGPEHPEVAVSIAATAGVAYMTSKYDDAIAIYGQALAMLERTVGVKDHRYANVLDQLASTWEWNGDAKQAIALHGKAVAIDREVLPAGHPQTLRAIRNYASARELEQRYDEAHAQLEEVLGHLEQSVPVAHRLRGETLNQLAILRLNVGDHSGAYDLAMRAYATYRDALGARYRPYAELLTAGQALMALRRQTEAADVLEEAVASLLPTEDPRQAAWIRSWLGRALVESRRDVARGKKLVLEAWPVLAHDDQTEAERSSLRPWMRSRGLRTD